MTLIAGASICSNGWSGAQMTLIAGASICSNGWSGTQMTLIAADHRDDGALVSARSTATADCTHAHHSAARLVASCV